MTLFKYFLIIPLVFLITNQAYTRGSRKPKVETLKISASTTSILYTNQELQFSASGGVPPYKFSANIGTINETSGAYIAPSNAGEASIKVTDSKGNTSTYNVSVYQKLEINPVNTTLLAGGIFQFKATGGVPPYSFSSEGGSIVSSTGVFTAPSAAGSAKITVTDSRGNKAISDVIIQAQETIPPNENSDCYLNGTSSGSGSLPYYRLPVIGHGNPGGLVWSSSTLSKKDQKNFTTDSRFNIRIVAKASPPKKTKDYKGKSCKLVGIPFSKIKLTVGLRRPNSNYYTGSYDISGIPVGKCSDVYEFTGYQIPATSGPIVLDILNFQHDYYCKLYENGPYAGNPQFCPYMALYANDCFSIEVQFATDFTLDIPH